MLPFPQKLGHRVLNKNVISHFDLPLRPIYQYPFLSGNLSTVSTFKVCAKSENYEKWIFFYIYIFLYVFLGVERVFIIKNGNFLTFLLQVLPGYWKYHLMRNIHSYLLYTAKEFCRSFGFPRSSAAAPSSRTLGYQPPLKKIKLSKIIVK